MFQTTCYCPSPVPEAAPFFPLWVSLNGLYGRHWGHWFFFYNAQTAVRPSGLHFAWLSFPILEFSFGCFLKFHSSIEVPICLRCLCGFVSIDLFSLLLVTMSCMSRDFSLGAGCAHNAVFKERWLLCWQPVSWLAYPLYPGRLALGFVTVYLAGSLRWTRVTRLLRRGLSVVSPLSPPQAKLNLPLLRGLQDLCSAHQRLPHLQLLFSAKPQSLVLCELSLVPVFRQDWRGRLWRFLKCLLCSRTLTHKSQPPRHPQILMFLLLSFLLAFASPTVLWLCRPSPTESRDECGLRTCPELYSILGNTASYVLSNIVLVKERGVNPKSITPSWLGPGDWSESKRRRAGVWKRLRMSYLL